MENRDKLMVYTIQSTDSNVYKMLKIIKIPCFTHTNLSLELMLKENCKSGF